jgi:dTDP-4-dehydrorhamnose 3,5-epimerase
LGALTVQDTPIAGVHVVKSSRLQDDRGEFARLYCEEELAPWLRGRGIVQVNHSVTHGRGAVRGMHFQWPPHAEMKFVRCLRGRAWDVAVDLRAGSPTFLQWFAHELAPQEADMMMIPEGCAHGFQVLEPDTELLYLHTSAYAPQAEGALRWDEPRVGIRWPLPLSALSPRDASHPSLAADFPGLRA